VATPKVLQPSYRIQKRTQGTNHDNFVDLIIRRGDLSWSPDGYYEVLDRMVDCVGISSEDCLKIKCKLKKRLEALKVIKEKSEKFQNTSSYYDEICGKEK
jgi:hypothetical protein